MTLILISSEGNVGRHVEDDAVALAVGGYTGAMQLVAQFGFLIVHVITDRTAGQTADGGTDHRVVALVPPPTARPPSASRPAPMARHLPISKSLLIRIRVGGSAGGKNT